ncbi:MAG: hypothetical protein ACYCX4_04035 [Bacillota bacterium]
MRKVIILMALVIIFLLSTTSAFAMVGAEKPPDGMVGITSVDAGTSVEEPAGLTTDEEMVKRTDKVEGEGVDPSMATTDIPLGTDMVLTAEPLENRMDVTSESPEQSTMERSIPASADQVLAAAVDDSAKNNAIPVSTYYLASAGLLAAVIGFVALRRRSLRQGA